MRRAVALLLVAMAAAAGAALLGRCVPGPTVALDPRAGSPTPHPRRAPDAAPSARRAAAPGDIAPAVEGSILGIVLAPDGAPVAGATVTAVPEASAGPGGGMRSSSDDDGTFEVRGLAAGRVAVGAAAAGYGRSAPRRVVVRADAVPWVVLRLEPRTFVAGRVTFSSGGPAAGVRVEALPDGRDPVDRLRPGESASAATGPDGRFRIEGLSGRRFDVAALPDDRSLAPAWRGGVPAGRDDVELVLERGASLSGVVVEAGTGAPIAGASVGVGPRLRRRTVTTGAEGRFELAPLAPERQLVRASAPGRAPALVEVPLAPGERRDDLRIELGEECAVAGVVRAEEDGAPLEGALVVVIPPGRKRRAPFLPTGEELLAEAQAGGADLAEWAGPDEVAAIRARSAATDEGGRFAFRGLPPGEQRLYAAHADRPGSGATTPPLEPGGTAEVEIALERAGAIGGRVLDPGGAPRGDELVAAISLSGHLRAGRTGEDGEYRLGGLAAGTYVVGLGAEVSEALGGLGGLRPVFDLWQASRLAVVERGRLTRLDFGAEPGAVLSGRVVRGATPAEGVLVELIPDGPLRDLRAARTDAEGRFEVALRPGSYAVRIEGSGEDLDVPPGVPRLERDFRLPGGSIAGRVVTAATGGPLAGALVAARGEAGEGETATAPDGGFRIRGLAPGTYALTVEAEGFVPARRDGIEVPRDGEPPPLEIACVPGGTIRGSVTDERGAPVPDAAVWIVAATGDEPPPSTLPRTGEDGRFEVRRFAPGRYRVTVLTETHAPWRREVDFPGGALELPIGLSRGGALTVAVSDATGAPLPDALIELRYPDGELLAVDLADFIEPTKPAGPDGRLRRTRLPAGPIRGGVRSEPGAGPPREAAFEARIADGAEVEVAVRVPWGP